MNYKDSMYNDRMISIRQQLVRDGVKVSNLSFSSSDRYHFNIYFNKRRYLLVFNDLSYKFRLYRIEPKYKKLSEYGIRKFNYNLLTYALNSDTIKLKTYDK